VQVLNSPQQDFLQLKLTISTNRQQALQDIWKKQHLSSRGEKRTKVLHTLRLYEGLILLFLAQSQQVFFQTILLPRLITHLPHLPL
jgi:hypothetical protein